MQQSTQFLLSPGGCIQGELTVPGDKSISHRSIIFASLADGVSHIQGFLSGEDCLATIRAFREMGVNIEGPDDGRVTVHGVGLHGLKAPKQVIDCGNSGTSIRLLIGLLSAQPFTATLTGDESLQKRPMRRVTDPLIGMGAAIKTHEGKPPLTSQVGSKLSAIHYKMPVASAQVKSCLLLAGLYAEGKTTITEAGITRDHSERMLKSFGYPIESQWPEVSIESGHSLTATDLTIPADISSAAFFMVAASIAPGSKLRLKNVGINPTRTGVIDILKLMGADIQLENQQNFGAEPVADICVNYAPLHGIEIPEDKVPLAIDEFPIIFIAAACAQGETVLRGAAELRVKESDRIAAMINGLKQLGIDCEAYDDGARINGGQMQGGQIDSLGDHRIAMAFAMAALRAQSPIIINHCANVATSFPNFTLLAKQVGLQIQES